jgi:hypothetical protein
MSDTDHSTVEIGVDDAAQAAFRRARENVDKALQTPEAELTLKALRKLVEDERARNEKSAVVADDA